MKNNWQVPRAAEPLRGSATALGLIFCFSLLVLTIHLLCKDSLGSSPLWPANGALVVAWLVLPRRLSLAVIGVCLVINIGLNLADGLTLFDALRFGLLNSGVSLLVAVLTRRFCGAGADLSRFRRLAAFTGVALASVTVEATLGEGLDRLVQGTPIQFNDWAQWILGDSLGLIICTPAILLATKNRRAGNVARGALMERLFLLALTIAVTVFAFLSSRSPAFLFIYPLLILVAFRSGPAWVLGSVLGVCLLASAFTAHGFGPLSYLSPSGPILMEGAIQPFLISLFLCAIPANNVIGERYRAAVRLARLHNTARAAQRDAVTANAAKSQFIANISHEIRTPLNGVLGMAQSLAKTDLSPLQRGRLDVIQSSGEVLLGLLNDVLDFSKIEAGKLEFESTIFDAERLLRDVHEIFSPLADLKGLDFPLLIAPEVQSYFHGDPTRIRQVVSNLVSNAVKFTQTGAVRIVASLEGGALTVEVIDTGIGIPEDKISKLFGKFQQVDASTTRRFGGTGLGLSICLDLALLMGGAVDVRSILGEGSTFAMRLPLAIASPDEIAALISDEAEPTGCQSVTEQGELRILAAEDNKTNQLVLKTLLGELDLDPVIVDDGAEAVDAWRAGAFDLILMDMQMPVMDGLTAAQAIRAEEAQTGRTRTPIIALTADVMAHQIARYRTAGIDGVVGKPIQFPKLVDAMNAVFKEHASPSPTIEFATAG